MSTGTSPSITIIVNNVTTPPSDTPSSPFNDLTTTSSAPARTTPSLQTFASRQLRVPFQVGQDGSISTVTALSVIAAQEIRSILATMPGTRMMRPSYGSVAFAMVFEPIQDDLDGLAEQIRDSLVAQVHTSTIKLVNCTHSDDTPSQIDVTVEFTVGPFQTVETTVVSITN